MQIWDVFFQTLTLGIVSTNRQTSSKGFTLQGLSGVAVHVWASHVGQVVGVDRTVGAVATEVFLDACYLSTSVTS